MFKLVAEDTGGTFELVEHPGPKTLAAPIHTHSREDDYSYVLDGAVGGIVKSCGSTLWDDHAAAS